MGAGAVGGFIGARLAFSGRAVVSALARGDTLNALRTHGWRLLQEGRMQVAPAIAAAAASELGPQDLVVIAVKGPALCEVAAQIRPLLDSRTVVLPAMNGVPWWFCSGVPGWSGAPIRAVDPDGAVLRAIPVERVLGCSVYAGASCPEPGLVEHHHGTTLHIGEPDGTVSRRVRQVVDLFNASGFDARLSTGIRHRIWDKLYGNITMNPLSAVTGATMTALIDDRDLRSFMLAVMSEAAAVGAVLGCKPTRTPAQRMADAKTAGAFKTSMLQDAQAGRPLEIDALVAAVQEIGRHCGVGTPSIDALLGIVRVFARTRGLYPMR